jgi:erythromycin esterase
MKPGKRVLLFTAVLLLAPHVRQHAAGERTFGKPPAEALEWIRSAAIPLKTAEPGDLDDLAPLANVVGKARVVALGEATHGTREFFQLKHRTVQFLVEKMGFTVFGIEATMPGTLVVNDYVLHGKGSATAGLDAMQFWTWNTDEVRALIEWMRAWNATHERKVKFVGFDMQDPNGALTRVLQYLEPRDAEYAATVRSAFAALQSPSEYKNKNEAAKQQVLAALDTLTKHVEAQKPHDADWQLARRMVEVIRQGEAQMHRQFAQVRDRAMAENAQWLLAQEPAGTKMVLWAHNGHVSAEPAPFFANGTMGSHLRRMFGKDLVIVGFAFNRGNFRAIDTRMKRELTSGNHLDAAPAGSFDAALASAGPPLFLLDLRTARGVARQWVDSPLQSRGVGATFDADHPEYFTEVMHPLRSYDAVYFVENMTPAHGQDRPVKTAGPPPPPPAPSAVNLDFEQGTAGEVPQGWQQAGTSNGGFRTRLVADGCASGRCAELSHPEPESSSPAFGVFMQRIDATPYRGKRVRLRGKVRSELNGESSSAHLWLRVDRPERRLGFFDNMSERMPHALPKWTELTIEGDVAADAEAIAFGSLFLGSGRAWYDDFVLEVVP